jgi:precorrin-6A/cobalt-precorrin-6A reductase
VLVSVVSDYGRELAAESNLMVHTGALDCEGLVLLLQTRQITLAVDASHPYAVNVSQNAQCACQMANVAYLRYERPRTALPDYERLHVVADATAAAKTAASLGRVVFLTTGSRTLKIFKIEPTLRDHRLIARVLPETSVIEECIALGFMPQDIVAIQGPFSHELNVAMFRQTGADVIVTKNSGVIGGSDSKFTAAMELGLPIIMIDRPVIAYSAVAVSFEEVLRFLKHTQP